MSFFDDVREFHEKFGLGYDGPPRPLPPEVHELRRLMQLEETRGQSPVAFARVDGAPAHQDAVAPMTDRTNHDFRVLVVDEAAIGADLARAVVALRNGADEIDAARRRGGDISLIGHDVSLAKRPRRGKPSMNPLLRRMGA